jgi:hypothetical protein
LRLTGGIARGTRLDVALMEERFGAALGSLAIDEKTVAYDYDAVAAEPTVRGHVVRDLLERARGHDPSAAAVADAALRYALAAFEGAEPAP